MSAKLPDDSGVGSIDVKVQMSFADCLLDETRFMFAVSSRAMFWAYDKRLTSNCSGK
jgi:hypothetical protein